MRTAVTNALLACIGAGHLKLVFTDFYEYWTIILIHTHTLQKIIYIFSIFFRVLLNSDLKMRNDKII